MSTSRRGFLRGRFAAERAPLRPPWALAEAAFAACCTRCGACQRACPAAIVVAGAGGYPEVDFTRGECSFCGECAAACQPRALLRADGRPAWQLALTLGDGCIARQGVECRVCGESCGEGAIRFVPRIGGAALPLVAPERCTGCGACVAPCPAAAIDLKQAHALESTS